MPTGKTDPMRAVLGTNLQTGALRAILILGAFAFVGASLAWLVHQIAIARSKARHAEGSPHVLTDLPNVLTLSRIGAIPVIVVLAALHSAVGNLGACIVFSLAGITDYWDGRLARDRSQTSDVGRMLDPIADKLLVGAALMILAGQSRLSGWGLYPAIIILLREILVSGLREYLAGLRVGLPVTALAKWKTGFQMGALGTLLAGDDTAVLLHLSFLPVSLIGELMLWVAAVLTLMTGWDYLKAGLRHATTPSGVIHRR